MRWAGCALGLAVCLGGCVSPADDRARQYNELYAQRPRAGCPLLRLRLRLQSGRLFRCHEPGLRSDTRVARASEDTIRPAQPLPGSLSYWKFCFSRGFLGCDQAAMESAASCLR